MKHDPSTYVGIGKDGFRGPDPYDPFYDNRDESNGSVKFQRVGNSSGSTRLLTLAVFVFVGSMLAYFFLLA